MFVLLSVHEFPEFVDIQYFFIPPVALAVYVIVALNPAEVMLVIVSVRIGLVLSTKT